MGKAAAHLALTELVGPRSFLARVFTTLVFALVVEMSVVWAFAVVVACAVLVLWICTALIIQMLGIRPMQMAGLLGGPFGEESCSRRGSYCLSCARGSWSACKTYRHDWCRHGRAASCARAFGHPLGV